jgi:hypothetical protein
MIWNSIDKLASSTFILEFVIYIYLTNYQNLQMHVCSKLASGSAWIWEHHWREYVQFFDKLLLMF